MAKDHIFTTRLTWTGRHTRAEPAYDSYGRDYIVEAAGKPALAGAAPAVFLGDDTRWSPEDLFVASMSACHMLTYLAMCARDGVKVTAYEDDASGTIAMKDGRMRFVDVLLRPRVTVAAADQVDKATALHDKAHHGCFVANSLNFDARCEPTVTAG